MTQSFSPILSVDKITSFLDSEFPQLIEGGRVYTVEEIAPGHAVMRLRADTRHLRPGGTVSGPSLFMLADLAAYVAILGHIGPIGLTVTTSATINFLCKPEPGDLLCTANILKLGSRLVVVECAIRADGADDLVAHAVATYSIPKR